MIYLYVCIAVSYNNMLFRNVKYNQIMKQFYYMIK